MTSVPQTDNSLDEGMAKSHWYGQLKQIIIAIIILGTVIPLFMQIIILLTQQTNLKDDKMLNSHHILYVDLELRKSQIDSLSAQISELEDVRLKAVKELLRFDKERTKLMKELEAVRNKKSDSERHVRELSKIISNYKKEIEFLEKVRQQSVVTNYVYVGVPKKPQIIPGNTISAKDIADKSTCTNAKCFDFSKCSILKDFNIKFIQPENVENNIYYELFKKYFINSFKVQSCLTLLIFDTKNFLSKEKYILKTYNSKYKNQNIIIYLVDNSHSDYCDVLKKVSSLGAVIATKFCPSFRQKYDLLIPYLLPDDPKFTPWKNLPMLLPVRRNTFLFFHSEKVEASLSCSSINPDDLKILATDLDIKIKVTCSSNSKVKPQNHKKTRTCSWTDCLTSSERKRFLEDSLFTIIIVDHSNENFFSEIIECFSFGSIPVIIGDIETMPFNDIIDWRLSCVFTSYQRLPELIYLLRTISYDKIFFLKLQGRFVYKSYFNKLSDSFRTAITALKNSIGLPANIIKDVHATPLINVHSMLQEQDSNINILQNKDLNFTYLGVDSYMTWNNFPGALEIIPVTIWNKPMPPRLQFLEHHKELYMPIGNGKGGDGTSFSRSLGGDYQLEQFTIIMLTYDRNNVLIEALLRLSGLKYLHKVIVVWNNRKSPPHDMQWPDIGAKIEVIYGKENSLNNRFIPYENIKTEAILSMDDDIYLRHDEIELAFRVWRENRDRLVGFPGRHHAYNSTSQNFYYDPEHSCELSLVLTGGAFFHKYYSYVYTFKLAKAVHDMVDNFMNCEDIAMNFLVSHITQKPPIKVTSRWTFRCSGCNETLALDPNHYKERNQCIQHFEKIFGYNPLKRTQFRADSVLFKTRLPAGMKKCFQYV